MNTDSTRARPGTSYNRPESPPTSRKTPVNIVYGLEDSPPLIVNLLVSFQHVLLLIVGLILPVIIASAGGAGISATQSFVSYTMITGGVGTILLALRWGSFGSGYLCPENCDTPYISGSILALRMGGFPLLFGMTVFAGIFQALFSRLLHRLRAVFPPEVTGVVVCMVGFGLISFAVNRFFGMEVDDSGRGQANLLTAAVTLGVMVGTNVWSQKLRQYSMLIGMLAGYLMAWQLGLFEQEQIRNILGSPLVSLPSRSHIGWSFNPVLIVPFCIAALSSSLKTVGNLTTCQKINDENWRRPEMHSISGGILAESLTTLAGGLLGSMGHATSSSNVGLSSATGVTSRKVALVSGVMFILLAFFPRLSAVLAFMPDAVMGAALIFCVCFMVLTGMQIILSRMVDIRRTFVIGLSLIFGLSVDIFPEFYADIHPSVQPLFSSSVTLATIAVVVLNLVLRIGVAKRQTLELAPARDTSEAILTFMKTCGASWGARPEVIDRAAHALNELWESIQTLELTTGPVQAEVTFDEFNLNITASYDGVLMEIPEARPTQEELLNDDSAFTRLSGFMIRHYTDRAHSSVKKGRCQIQLHFEH